MLATFASGCFWCTEAVFAAQKGVHSVVPGYAGGHVENPSYEMVCGGTTGHAECAQIAFDPHDVSYDSLLDVFFHAHDPTTLNRQGNDVGTQYRSAVFYHDDSQRAAAEAAVARHAPSFPAPIVTEIVPLARFWPADEYHHNYYALNADRNPYCSMVIRPKLVKLGLEKN